MAMNNQKLDPKFLVWRGLDGKEVLGIPIEEGKVAVLEPNGEFQIIGRPGDVTQGTTRGDVAAVRKDVRAWRDARNNLCARAAAVEGITTEAWKFACDSRQLVDSVEALISDRLTDPPS